MEFVVEFYLGFGRYFNSGSMIRLSLYLGVSLTLSSLSDVVEGGEDDILMDGRYTVDCRQLFVAMIAVVTAYVLQI